MEDLTGKPGKLPWQFHPPSLVPIQQPFGTELAPGLSESYGRETYGDEEYTRDQEVFIYEDTRPYAPNIRIMHFNSFDYPDVVNDWHPHMEGAHLHSVKVAKEVWLKLAGLNQGDTIRSYTLKGNIIEAAAVTIDCKLTRVNLADPITTTDLTNGAIVQVTADGIFRATANVDDEIVATDKCYCLVITGTTGAGDEVDVIGAEVEVLRLRD